MLHFNNICYVILSPPSARALGPKLEVREVTEEKRPYKRVKETRFQTDSPRQFVSVKTTTFCGASKGEARGDGVTLAGRDPPCARWSALQNAKEARLSRFPREEGRWER